MTNPKTPIRPPARTAILRAAAAIYSVSPSASIERVAEAAGVSRATLFRHFADRDDLIRSAGRECLAELDGALGSADLRRGDARSRLLRLLDVLIGAGLQWRFAFAYGDILDDGSLAKAAARLDRHVDPVIAAALREGLFRKDVPEAWFREAFDALLFACWTVVERGRVARADAPALLLRTLVEGFGKGRRV